MKKMLSLLLVGLMAVSMTGCGKSSSNEDRTLIIGSEKI